MLTLFPHLLTYGLVSPLLIRVSLGVLGLIGANLRRSKTKRWLAIVYVVVSVLLIIGLYTQVAAILAFILAGLDDAIDKNAGIKLSKERMLFRGFIAIVAISLIFTGAGFFAFDLPL